LSQTRVSNTESSSKALRPFAKPESLLPDVPRERIPRHVAIIMDGNGRWATQQGMPRFFGHRAGAGSVREVVEGSLQLGIECLTLYSFSLENWKRPKDEVEALMRLCLAYLEGERDEMARQGIRLRILGSRDGLPPDVLAAMDDVTAATAHNRDLTLCLAINYGSRAEMTHAARELARKVAMGELKVDDIDEQMFADQLYTRGLPDPDLLIRTAGELRVSNYLLWQISYAELYVTPTLWPDFGRHQLAVAVRAFSQRTRKFGGLAEDAILKDSASEEADEAGRL
jgi:undecaprenyl diphosphate synthase